MSQGGPAIPPVTAGFDVVSLLACSGSMAGIGQCLGALARVNLKLFCTGECSVDALQERLRKVGTCTRDSEETMLTAFIVVPVLARQVCLGWSGLNAYHPTSCQCTVQGR